MRCWHNYPKITENSGELGLCRSCAHNYFLPVPHETRVLFVETVSPFVRLVGKTVSPVILVQVFREQNTSLS